LDTRRLRRSREMSSTSIVVLGVLLTVIMAGLGVAVHLSG
jgi:hypothetical protein